MEALHWIAPCYGEHLGHNETIKSQMPGELQFIPQLNPSEPLCISPWNQPAK